MKLTLYCACGGSMTGTVSPTAEAEAVEAMFRRGHDSPECSPTDARGARNARRRQERTVAS